MGIGASTHISVVAGASNFGASYNFNDIGVAELLIDAAGGHVTTYSASMLDCTVFSGCIVGMLSFGHLGDRFGRRHAMAMALGIAVLGSLMSGLSAGEIEKSLIVWRVVLGLGIGGVYPLSAALAYEAAPDAEDEVKDSAASSDGRNPELQVARANFWQCISQTILYCFALVLLAMPVSYAAVWRLLLAAGAAPFALAAGSLAAGGLQSESTDFRSAARTRGTVVSADDFRARVVAGGHVCSLVPASACWALYNFVAFGFSVYAPEILDAVLGGLSLRQNLQLNAAASLFTVIGGFTSLLLVRAHGSRLAVAGGAAVMGVSSALVGVACFDTCASTVLVLSLMSFARFGCALRLIVRACVCGAVRCGAVAVRRAALCCAALRCAAVHASAFPVTPCRPLVSRRFQLPGIPVFTLPNVLFPADIRAGCHGVAAAVGKVGAAIGTYMFPIMIAQIGVGPVFLIAGGFCILLLFISLAFVPPSTSGEEVIANRGEQNTALLDRAK